ncbi:MAG: YfiR family protein [Burkholderiaceae bacterium]|nr:YfiR family protein [Burkholderiaceae bacterium]
MNPPASRVQRRRRTVLRAMCAIAPWDLWLRAGRAVATHAAVEQVKAAYLLKFPDFVEWPPHAFPTANSPFVIAVSGADDVYLELRAMASGSRVLGRAVDVLRLQNPEPGIVTQLVFVGKDRAGQLPTWVDAYAGRPVVIVADTAGALESGAALNFVEIDDRLRFEAAPAAAERSGLRLSSRLLGVAERVLKTRS